MVLFNYGTYEGALARTLGRLAHLLGRSDAAIAHFDTALSITERLKAPYWIARTQLDYADLLRDVRRNDEAAQLVGQALETAKTFGFAALESRATTFPA
jgi:tetratricopeptide (TPR) repeat protein